MGGNKEEYNPETCEETYEEWELKRRKKLFLIRSAVVLALLGVAGGVAECEGKYVTKGAEVVSAHPELQQLLDLEKYLEANSARIISGLKRVNKDRLWSTVGILKELREKIVIANESLPIVAESSIRFDRGLIVKAISEIDKILRKTRTQRVRKLHRDADTLRQSKRGWNVKNRIASYYVDTDALIALSINIKNVVLGLNKLKNNLRAISGPDVNDGISNNEVLNFYLEHVRGREGL